MRKLAQSAGDDSTQRARQARPQQARLAINNTQQVGEGNKLRTSHAHVHSSCNSAACKRLFAPRQQPRPAATPILSETHFLDMFSTSSRRHYQERPDKQFLAHHISVLRAKRPVCNCDASLQASSAALGLCPLSAAAPELPLPVSAQGPSCAPLLADELNEGRGQRPRLVMKHSPLSSNNSKMSSHSVRSGQAVRGGQAQPRSPDPPVCGILAQGRLCVTSGRLTAGAGANARRGGWLNRQTQLKSVSELTTAPCTVLQTSSRPDTAGDV